MDDRREDDPTGFDRAPDRYTGSGRETIDRMRDAAGPLFWRALARGARVEDAVFAAHCHLDAMKYEDRAGKKGDAQVDRDKGLWYRQMARHVEGYDADPRKHRDVFVPYAREAYRFDGVGAEAQKALERAGFEVILDARAEDVEHWLNGGGLRTEAIDARRPRDDASRDEGETPQGRPETEEKT